MTCEIVMADILEWANQQLEAASIDDAEECLRDLARLHLADLFDKAAQRRFALAIRERCNRVPLGHLTGSVLMDGHEYVVGTGVFIPRRQSVPLLDWISRFDVLPDGARVLDLCSGTGFLGIGLARRRPDLAVTCIEMDPTAFQYLQRNVFRAGIDGIKVETLREDVRSERVLNAFRGKVDGIITNPPCVPSRESLRPEFEKHHPEVAIYSGNDGLELSREIVHIAASVLRQNGAIAIEHFKESGPDIYKILQAAGFGSTESLLDSDGEPRLSAARFFSPNRRQME